MVTKMRMLRLLLIWMMIFPVFASAASASASAGLLYDSSAAASATEHFEGCFSVIRYEAPDGTWFHMEKFDPDNSIHMGVVRKIEREKTPYYEFNEAEIQRKKELGYYGVPTPFGDYIFFKNRQPIGTCALAIEDIDKETEALEKALRRDSDEDPCTEYKKPLEELSLHPETLDFLRYKKDTFISRMEFGDEEFYASIGIYLDPDNRRGGIGKIMNCMLRHFIIDPLVGKTCDYPMASGGRFVAGKTSSPFLGSLSLVALDNLPSLASQLAGDEVSLCIAAEPERSGSQETFKAYFIFYPPQPEKSSADHLILAKEIIAMEKAHRAVVSDAAAATASGSGGPSSP